MKLTLITSEPLYSEEENILSVIDDLTEDHALEINLKHDLKDLLFSLFKQTAEVSKTDSECLTVKRVWMKGKARYESVSLETCSLKDNVLYCKDQLWVLTDNQLRLEILQKVHNSLISDHLEITHTEALLWQYYFWLRLQTLVKHYCWNCHDCCQIKASKEKLNRLLQSLSILIKRWENIVMNFITDLSKSDSKNIILIIINCLSKERHYVSCSINENGTSAE